MKGRSQDYDLLIDAIEEHTTGTVVAKRYFSGLDLGSSTDATRSTGSGSTTGNVVQGVSITTGTTIATYEYSPFGEVIVSSGTFATQNRFRFSTKYQDEVPDGCITATGITIPKRVGG